MALKNNFEPLFFHSWYRLCCCCSIIKSCLTLWNPWTAAGQALHPSLSPRVCSNSCPLSWWCCLIISSSATPSPSAFTPSQLQGLFQWVGFAHQVAKVLELQLQHQSFSKDSALISFRIDWFDLLGVQETLKSLLHHQIMSIHFNVDFFLIHLIFKS